MIQDNISCRIDVVVIPSRHLPSDPSFMLKVLSLLPMDWLQTVGCKRLNSTTIVLRHQHPSIRKIPIIVGVC